MNSTKMPVMTLAVLAVVMIMFVIQMYLFRGKEALRMELLEGLSTCTETLDDVDLTCLQISVELGKCEAERADLIAERDVERDSDSKILEDGLSRMADELPCQMDVNEWAARVEGIGRVPAGTFKQIADSAHGGTPPRLTHAQKVRLMRAIDQNPPPKCVDEKENKP